MNNHMDYMQQALDQARQAEMAGEVPVGAVLVKQGEIIASGFNQPILSCDPTAHAEIMALRQAGQQQANYRLTDTTLYVTLEPCIMCLGAILHARVERLIYAASDPKVGAVSLLRALSQQACFNHHLEVEGGVLAEESSQLLKTFFRRKR